MIYSYSILTGYISLRGTIFLHLPMLIIMFFFVKVPKASEGEEDLEPLFWTWRIWYWFAFIMHGILTFMNVSLLYPMSSAVETVREGIQMVAVLAEILNFTTMLTLLAEDGSYSLPWAEMTVSEKTFKLWIIIESLIFIMTVFTNVLYVLVRGCCRSSISIDLPSDHQDIGQDFLHAVENRLAIDLLNMFCGPILIFFFFTLGRFANEGLSDDEKRMLTS